jgi:hypothetical protein
MLPCGCVTCIENNTTEVSVKNVLSIYFIQICHTGTIIKRLTFYLHGNCWETMQQCMKTQIQLFTLIYIHVYLHENKSTRVHPRFLVEFVLLGI